MRNEKELEEELERLSQLVKDLKPYKGKLEEIHKVIQYFNGKIETLLYTLGKRNRV